MDLDAYFGRIGYSGGRSPSLDDLTAIVLHHTRAIAFENLNPLLGWPVALDSHSLEQKLIRDGRGGYCYEHNHLFRCVLESLGVSAVGLAARVVWNQPAGVTPPRSHMLLLADLDGAPHIIDVGFGIQSPILIRLVPDIEQLTSYEPYRLLQFDDEYVLQVKIRGEWMDAYRFDLQAQFPADYEVCNWFCATHPESLFVTGLVAVRPSIDRRYTLRNNALSVYHRDGTIEQQTLCSVAELRATLSEQFLLRLPDAARLDEALARVIEP